MRQYTEKKRKETEKVFCNQCGKEIRKQGEMFAEDYLCVEKRWGYFSKKDNEVHRFELCEDCYDKLCASFRIPVDIEK